MSECCLRRAARGVPLLVFAACVLAGCGPVTRIQESNDRIDGGPTVAAEDAIELVLVDRAGYDAALAELRGRVVLVDFWATWCAPCIEQIPHTVELASRLRDRGLAVVTVSLDDPEQADQVGELLRSQDADELTNLISRFGASPQSMEAFEISGGAVPHYKLYDRDGRLQRTFGLDPTAAQQFTPEDIDDAVEHLLSG